MARQTEKLKLNTMTVIKSHETTKEFLLKYQYKGYLGNHNKPNYPADSYLFQSLFKIAHFHFCKN